MYNIDDKPQRAILRKENIYSDIKPILYYNMFLCVLSSTAMCSPIMVFVVISRNTWWLYVFLFPIAVIQFWYGWFFWRYVLQLYLAKKFKFKIEESKVYDKFLSDRHHWYKSMGLIDPLPDGFLFANRQNYFITYRAPTDRKISERLTSRRVVYFYEWCIDYSMSNFELYKRTDIGDEFYLITYEGKNLITRFLLTDKVFFKNYRYIMVYNKKFFEYKDV